MEPGARIGDYEILDELGRGGMGRVYRVRNVISDRTDAMKVLLPSLAGHEDLAARFLREIKVLAALDHPNIAALRTALTAGNQIVMIMELVEGEPLSRRLKRGPLPVGEAIACMDQMLAALAYAHERQVIHRDIKPANVMVGADGVVKLTDFGIARSIRDESLTATGTTTGSLPYMAPEQINGEPVDARADIYAAGISLYEMVTGRTPFQGTSEYGLMSAHLNETPRPAIEWRADLPAWLNDCIMRAIRKDPAARFQSASEFRAALQGHALEADGAAAATEIIRRPPPVPGAVSAYGPPPDGRQPRARAVFAHPLAYMALGGVVIVALAAGTGAYLRRAEAGLGQDRRPETPVTDLTGDRALPDGGPDSTGGVPAGTPLEAGPGAAPEVPASIPSQAPPEPPAAVSAPQRRTDAAGSGPAAAPSAAVMPSRPDLRDVPSTPPAAPAQQTAPAVVSPQTLTRLADEIDALVIRGSAVDESLAILREQQAREGLGLRRDILSRQRSLQLNLARAVDAADRGDESEARRYQQMAQADLEALEKFLGR